MKIEIIRNIYSDTSIAGELHVNGSFFCYTLELAYRNNIKLISSIPEGQYKIIYTVSGKIELTDTAPRTNIQIHKGNSVTDSSGCILVGDHLNTTGTAIHPGSSTPAYERLKKLVSNYYAVNFELIELEISGFDYMPKLSII